MGLASHCLIVWLAFFWLSFYILECESGESYAQECFLDICYSNFIFQNMSSIIRTFIFFRSVCEDKLPTAAGYKPANCKWKYCPALRLHCSKKWSQLTPVLTKTCVNGLTPWWKTQKVSKTCKKSCNICGMFIVSYEYIKFSNKT